MSDDKQCRFCKRHYMRPLSLGYCDRKICLWSRITEQHMEKRKLLEAVTPLMDSVMYTAAATKPDKIAIHVNLKALVELEELLKENAQ